jgi:archaellum component FlaC
MSEQEFDPKTIDAILERMEGIEESLEGMESRYSGIYNKLENIEDLLVKLEVKKKPFSEVFTDSKKFEGDKVKEIFSDLEKVDLNERQQEFVENIKQYFEQKSYITEKQLQALKKII